MGLSKGGEAEGPQLGLGAHQYSLLPGKPWLSGHWGARVPQGIFEDKGFFGPWSTLPGLPGTWGQDVCTRGQKGPLMYTPCMSCHAICPAEWL